LSRRAALILAGGKGRRFQNKGEKWEDKALANLNGRPLLVQALENVQIIVDEVALCVSDKKRGKKYSKILEPVAEKPLKVIVDEKTEISGPTVAIMSGLKKVNADYCLTLPCDMPFLQPKVADYLFSQAECHEIVTPMWPNGRIETLLNVLDRQKGLEITETLCDLRRPRSDDIQRGTGKILLASTVAEIKTLDPELRSFININSKEDLRHPRTRSLQGPVKENLSLNFEPASTSRLVSLREATEAFRGNINSLAAKAFGECARYFEESGSRFWTAVSWENQGEAFLALSKQQRTADAVGKLDSEAKEAFVRAANYYRLEAEMHLENCCTLLAERAFSDKAWCESWAMGKHSHVHRYPSKVD